MLYTYIYIYIYASYAPLHILFTIKHIIVFCVYVPWYISMLAIWTRTWICEGIGMDVQDFLKRKSIFLAHSWLACWLSTGRQDFYWLHVIACMVNIHGRYTGFGSQLSFLLAMICRRSLTLADFLRSALVYHLLTFLFQTGSNLDSFGERPRKHKSGHTEQIIRYNSRRARIKVWLKVIHKL